MLNATNCNYINNYFERHFGLPRDRRYTYEGLVQFFSDPANRHRHPRVYNIFSTTKNITVVPAENALNAYCERQDIYEQYVQDYYGQEQWFAFQRHFSNQRETSMVDIAARFARVQIDIYEDPDGAPIYSTEDYSAGTREARAIQYNGINHFVGLKRAAPVAAAVAVPPAASAASAAKDAGHLPALSPKVLAAAAGSNTGKTLSASVVASGRFLPASPDHRAATDVSKPLLFRTPENVKLQSLAPKVASPPPAPKKPPRPP